jgi:hypothetical protein
MSDDWAELIGGGNNVHRNADEVDDRTLNRAFDLLSDHRRRCVLETLRTTSNETMSIEELREHLLDHDHTTDDPNKELVRLQHAVLPRLNATTVIDYDRESGIVSYQGHALVEDLLTFIADEND